MQHVFEARVLQQSQRDLADELGFIRIGVETPGHDDGRRPIDQFCSQSSRLLDELGGRNFAIEDVELRVALNIAAGRVVLELDAENADLARAVMNQGKRESGCPGRGSSCRLVLPRS